MRYVFRVGEQGVGGPDLPEGFAHKPFTVVGKKEWRRFWDHDPTYYMSYEVHFHHEPEGSTRPLAVRAALLPPPKRGDLDEKAGWGLLPLAVVEAMKGAKS